MKFCHLLVQFRFVKATLFARFEAKLVRFKKVQEFVFFLFHRFVQFEIFLIPEARVHKIEILEFLVPAGGFQTIAELVVTLDV